LSYFFGDGDGLSYDLGVGVGLSYDLGVGEAYGFFVGLSYVFVLAGAFSGVVVVVDSVLLVQELISPAAKRTVME
jgi:hypothetical protein